MVPAHGSSALPSSNGSAIWPARQSRLPRVRANSTAAALFINRRCRCQRFMLVDDACLQCDVTLESHWNRSMAACRTVMRVASCTRWMGTSFEGAGNMVQSLKLPTSSQNLSPKIASDLWRRQQLLAVARGYFALVYRSARDSMACAPGGDCNTLVIMG